MERSMRQLPGTPPTELVDEAEHLEEVPPPPALDEFAPGTLVAVTEDLGGAHAAVRAAVHAGSSAPYVLGPDAVLRMEQEREADQGRLSRLYQLLAGLVSDQQTLQGRYLDHARAGRSMIVADAADDETVERVWHAIEAQGAFEGTWYSSSIVREMLPSEPRRPSLDRPPADVGTVGTETRM